MINFQDYFIYDESSPSSLRWKIDMYCGNRHNRPIVCTGDVAGARQKSGGYRVHLNKKGYEVHRIIYELLTGIRPSSDEIVDHRDGNASNNRIKNLRITSQSVNTRNRSISRNNTSGVNAIGIQQNTNVLYCISYWHGIDGKRKSKSFNVDKLGIMVAFRDAVIYRQKMIEELNTQGAGYTERHGKEQL